MKIRRSFVLCLALVGSTLLAQEQSPWPPVPPEDLALRDNPAQSGSSAMILLKKETRDDGKGIWESYHRIKVFTEKGREYANIEIPYLPKVVEVDQIAARVIQPDGRVSEFSGPVYEKILGRRRRLRLMAKTLSLPNIHPGTIIEYRYRWKRKDSGRISMLWVIQENLFIREAQLEFRPSGSGWRILPRRVPSEKEFQLGKDGALRTTLRDLPAFEEEPAMLPENSVKILYYLVHPRFQFGFSPEQYLQESVNGFIGKPKALAGIAQELVAPHDSPETKLRKLYLAVQERIRNLSYEEAYTRKELKREGMKERKSAADVWKLGYGTSEEITRLFVGLCRAAGFTSDVVFVAKRDDSLFDPDIPLIEQLEDEIAMVNLGEELRYFDPGTRFAPAGWVSWEKQGVHGLRLGEKRTQEVKTSLQDAEKNRRHRQFELELKPDGTARIHLVTTYWGQEALERRNEFFETSKKDRDRKLREELEEFFPTAVVQEVSWEGLDDSSDTAKITYRFELPGFAQALSSRLLVRAYVFERASRFPNWKRKHPVYLRAPNSFTQEVHVLPPPGYRLEHAPLPQKQDLGVAKYEMSTSQEGNNVLCRSRVTTQASILTEPEHYLRLKRFYDLIAANEQAVLVFRRP